MRRHLVTTLPGLADKFGVVLAPQHDAKTPRILPLTGALPGDYALLPDEESLAALSKGANILERHRHTTYTHAVLKESPARENVTHPHCVHQGSATGSVKCLRCPWRLANLAAQHELRFRALCLFFADTLKMPHVKIVPPGAVPGGEEVTKRYHRLFFGKDLYGKPVLGVPQVATGLHQQVLIEIPRCHEMSKTTRDVFRAVGFWWGKAAENPHGRLPDWSEDRMKERVSHLSVSHLESTNSIIAEYMCYGESAMRYPFRHSFDMDRLAKLEEVCHDVVLNVCHFPKVRGTVSVGCVVRKPGFDRTEYRHWSGPEGVIFDVVQCGGHTLYIPYIIGRTMFEAKECPIDAEQMRRIAECLLEAVGRCKFRSKIALYGQMTLTAIPLLLLKMFDDIHNLVVHALDRQAALTETLEKNNIIPDRLHRGLAALRNTTPNISIIVLSTMPCSVLDTAPWAVESRTILLVVDNLLHSDGKETLLKIVAMGYYVHKVTMVDRRHVSSVTAVVELWKEK